MFLLHLIDCIDVRSAISKLLNDMRDCAFYMMLYLLPSFIGFLCELPFIFHRYINDFRYTLHQII